jgi:hypothetical protein
MSLRCMQEAAREWPHVPGHLYLQCQLQNLQAGHLTCTSAPLSHQVGDNQHNTPLRTGGTGLFGESFFGWHFGTPPGQVRPGRTATCHVLGITLPPFGTPKDVFKVESRQVLHNGATAIAIASFQACCPSLWTLAGLLITGWSCCVGRARASIGQESITALSCRMMRCRSWAGTCVGVDCLLLRSSWW